MSIHTSDRSGKTIIESLKYATTGDLPPNSRNGAFIHDPKRREMCGEKEVLAQVKLQFRDPSGAKLVATRNVSVTVQKTKYQQKTLDCSLLRHANGERVVISSRNAEIDKFVPQYLGVSKAVLDNVIFCHQDESLWPMSDSGTLKKKFDEIFEALKYTKAIQNIKDVRKHYMDELSKLQISEQNSKVIKDKADKALKQSSMLSDDIERLRIEVQDLDKLTNEATKKRQDAWDRSSKYSTIITELELKRKQAEWLREQTESLNRELKIRPESDDWLQSELDQYEEQVKVHEEQKQQQSNRYNQLQRTINDTRERLQGKHTDAGRYEQQKASHEFEIEARKTIVRSIARRHSIRGYEACLNDVQIGDFMERMTKLYQDQTVEIERVTSDVEKEKQKVQEALSKLGERRSGLHEGKSSATKQIVANDQILRSCQSDLDTIEIDEGAEAVLGSNVEEISESLKQAKEQYRNSSWDTKIHEARVQLRTSEAEVEHINREVVVATRNSKDLAQMEYLRKELSDRQRNLETLKGVHNDRLQSIVGRQWRVGSLERDFQDATEQRLETLRKSESRRNASAKELEQTDFKLTSCRDDLEKAEKELQDCARSVTNATGSEKPDTYPGDLIDSQADRDKSKVDVDDYANMRKFFKTSIETAQGKGRCKLCERSFHGHAEKLDFIKKMEAKIERNTFVELETQLKEAEEDLQKLRAVGPAYNNWLRIWKTERPKIQAEIQQLELSKATLVRQSEQCDKEVADLEDSRTDAEALSKPVSSIVRVHSEISSFMEQIKKLSGARENANTSPSMEELQEQLASLNAQARAKRSLIERLSVERQDARDGINTKELNLRDAKTELSMATHQLEKKYDLTKRIEDLRRSNREHRDTIKGLDDEIQALSPQAVGLESKLDDIKTRGNKKVQQLNQVATQLSDGLYELKGAHQKIQDYLENGGPSRLDKCHENIRQLQKDIEQMDAEQKQVTTNINKFIEGLRNHKDTRRTIKDNLDFRRSKRELEEVVGEINQLSNQNAEADLERLDKQAKHWDHQYHKHTTEKSSKLATMKAKDDQLRELLKDWNTEYQNAGHEYKEAHIKTTKAAIEDLGRYGSALDQAIMQYHSLKMEEINHIAEELWKRTYQGTDVDTILIRTDLAKAGGNRSYNYRVCMVKQDAEMDMRGRCSAGQRVLASIIIRLALAECFGVKCGLIALDEPTTNLDRDNIRSLAESLHDIIRARQQQSNFQLIVITHDEEFLRQMQCGDFCDTYYRLSRTDRQKSKIQREPITELV
ncbi:MAG: hypothetical protein Q9197_002473 [Variospora fuerteventurae]